MAAHGLTAQPLQWSTRLSARWQAVLWAGVLCALCGVPLLAAGAEGWDTQSLLRSLADQHELARSAADTACVALVQALCAIVFFVFGTGQHTALVAAAVAAAFALLKVIVCTEALPRVAALLCLAASVACFLALWHADVVFFDPDVELLRKDRVQEQQQSTQQPDGQQLQVSVLRQLVELATPDAALYISGFVFLLVTSALQLSIPNFTGRALAALIAWHTASTDSDKDGDDRHEAHKHRVEMLEQAGALLTVAILLAVFTACRIWSTAKAEVRLIARIQRCLFAAILSKDMSFFDAQATGSLTSRLTSDCTLLGTILTTSVNLILQSGISLLGSVAIIISINWRLGLQFLAICTIFFVLSFKFGQLAKRLQKRIQEVKSEANAVADQAISLIRIVRSFAAEQAEKDMFDLWSAQAVLQELKIKLAYTIYVPITLLVQHGQTLFVLLVGAIYLQRGDLNASDLTAFLLYSQGVQSSMTTLSSQIMSTMQGLGAGEKVIQLMTSPSNIPIAGGGQLPGRSDGFERYAQNEVKRSIVKAKLIRCIAAGLVDVDTQKTLSFKKSDADPEALAIVERITRSSTAHRLAWERCRRRILGDSTPAIANAGATSNARPAAERRRRQRKARKSQSRYAQLDADGKRLQEEEDEDGDDIVNLEFGLNGNVPDGDDAVELVDLAMDDGIVIAGATAVDGGGGRIAGDDFDLDSIRRTEAPPMSIEFRDVTFRYPVQRSASGSSGSSDAPGESALPSGPLILRGLNLRIEPGERVAVVGLSGGGKSTIMSLLSRFYEPEAGVVFFAGHDVNNLDPRWLRSNISVVSQDPMLFARSITDNIAYTAPDSSFASVREAAVNSCADPFVMELANGYNTVVGERGVTLSGGQRQRIAIARALHRQAGVIIFDEATSALDTETEQQVQALLLRDDSDQRGNRPTLIWIAHRLSTVKDCDRILVMANGRVEEDGSHTELLAKRGLYFSLVERQLDDEELVTPKQNHGNPGSSDGNGAGQDVLDDEVDLDA